MSLEVVDIQEVMHQVTEGKLVVVDRRKSKIEAGVTCLEEKAMVT